MTLAAGVGERLASTVIDGPLVVAVAVAAAVGLLSFLSPCVLPLVPGYLSYVTGLAGSTAGGTAGSGTAGSGTAGSGTAGSGTAGPGTAGSGTAGSDTAVALRAPAAQRRRVVAGALLFVLGFTAVFVSFGALFGGLGRLLLVHQSVITRVLGVVTIVMGLAFLGALPFAQRELRVHRLPATGLAGAPLLGIAFGLGWTPCLGPTLAAVQTLAVDQASAGRGAILGLAYCLGLGVPFVLTALGLRSVLATSAAARRHAGLVVRVGGVLLVVLGVLLVTGWWDALMIDLRSWLGSTGLGTSSL